MDEQTALREKQLLYIIAGFAAAELILHLYTNFFAGYGYFRDELYYIACSKRLDIGYVDQPPFSIYVLALSRLILGDSVFAIRLIPALASAATVYIAGLTLREIGGGLVATIIALLSLVLSPIFLAMNTFYSMNSFDWLLWTAAFYLVVRLLKTENQRLWLWLGLVIGIGLMNKISFLWFGAGLVTGLVFTPQRKFLRTKWPYLAALISIVLFSPYIVWNATHNFADLEFIRNATRLKYSSISRSDFVLGQILLNGPMSLPVWLGAIYFFFFDRIGKKFRLVGAIFVVTFLILLVNGHSKPEYLSPAIPVLFVGGGILFERISSFRRTAWVKYVLSVLVAVSGIVTVPLAIPILPVTEFISYQKSLHMAPATAEGKHLEELPQFYADMFGWKDMADSVSQVYSELSPDVQKNTVVYARNYGEAAAVEFFASKFPLPRVMCAHNNYWYWSLADTTATTVIAIGGSKEDYSDLFSTVREAGKTHCEYCMPYENNLTIFVLSGLKSPIKKFWPSLKFFI